MFSAGVDGVVDSCELKLVLNIATQLTACFLFISYHSSFLDMPVILCIGVGIGLHFPSSEFDYGSWCSQSCVQVDCGTVEIITFPFQYSLKRLQ
jgi:hypothetical protein